jgi:hypothetical protein
VPTNLGERASQIVVEFLFLFLFQTRTSRVSIKLATDSNKSNKGGVFVAPRLWIFVKSTRGGKLRMLGRGTGTSLELSPSDS